MNHKVETTRFGNTTLNADITMELQSAAYNSDEVSEAINQGTQVLMKAIADQKTALDNAAKQFFIVENHEELVSCK